MPWMETCAVELRESLVLAMLAGEASVAELCRRAGVSRKTAYKWLQRYKADGRIGLEDRSRARHSQPHAVSDAVMDAILTTRNEHPTWGVKKILPYLARTQPDLILPSLGTAGEILRYAGLTQPRSTRRRHFGPHNQGKPSRGPNETWTIDFKGQFRLGCRALCYPLTVADHFSRYLLCVDARPSTSLNGVMPSLQRLFREQGLPDRIKSDNGSPFAGTGLARLSRLSVWLMTLGIEVEHITPGRPCENGRHERMHRTLKAETASPPSTTMRGQQRRFNLFRMEYNNERPHEAIGQHPPATLYVPSRRMYDDKSVCDEDPYPGHWERRRVRSDGTMKWKGRLLYISEPLRGHLLGLVETDEGRWALHFQQTQIGLVEGSGESMRVRDVLSTRPSRSFEKDT